MLSETASALSVLVRALILARSLGMSEIGIDNLLAALDHEAAPKDPPGQPAGLYLPAPNRKCGSPLRLALPYGDWETFLAFPLKFCGQPFWTRSVKECIDRWTGGDRRLSAKRNSGGSISVLHREGLLSDASCE